MTDFRIQKKQSNIQTYELFYSKFAADRLKLNKIMQSFIQVLFISQFYFNTFSSRLLCNKIQIIDKT